MALRFSSCKSVQPSLSSSGSLLLGMVSPSVSPSGGLGVGAGALVGVALHEGYIESIDDPIRDYLPVLSSPTFDGVTIKHVLGRTWLVSSHSMPRISLRSSMAWLSGRSP